MSYKHIFTKTLEHADIIREYFKNYPEIFVISFCAFLNPDMMHQACEEIFPEKYRNPDMKNYINYHYGIENNNEE